VAGKPFALTDALLKLIGIRKAPRAYAAGRPAHRTRNWRADQSGPNAAIGPALAMLRARSRQMVRDNPYAARAVTIVAQHQIGYGITARWKDPIVQALWDEWCKHCDLNGMLDFNGQQYLAARTRSEAGEALLRLVPLTAGEMRRRGLKVPLQLELLEGDFLPEDSSTLLEGRTPASNRVVQGIEFNSAGQRVRYWMRREHPGELSGFLTSGDDLQAIPAEQILHIYRMQRPGQVRGVPDAASALLRLRQLDDYEDTAVQQAITQTMMGVFFTSNIDPEATGSVPGEEGAADIPAFDLVPGMTMALPPGTEPKFLQPTGAGSFEPFAMHALMAISVGWGVTYDQLTGDLRNANFSSLRAGKIEFRRLVETDQWQVFIPRMCQPVADAFLRAAIAAGALAPGEYPVEWGPPRMEMTNPGEEVPMLRDMVRSGLMSWPQAVSELGFDPERMLKEIQDWNAKLDAAGIILDSDPRRTTLSGGAQDPKQNAAVQLGANGRPAPAN
jgi:lambda family phage portal protein